MVPYQRPISLGKSCHVHGIDISSQRARQFVKEDIQTFDRIYIMAKEVLYEMEDIWEITPSERSCT